MVWICIKVRYWWIYRLCAAIHDSSWKRVLYLLDKVMPWTPASLFNISNSAYMQGPLAWIFRLLNLRYSFMSLDLWDPATSITQLLTQERKWWLDCPPSMHMQSWISLWCGLKLKDRLLKSTSFLTLEDRIGFWHQRFAERHQNVTPASIPCITNDRCREPKMGS
jgi:hypothetical protein